MTATPQTVTFSDDSPPPPAACIFCRVKTQGRLQKRRQNGELVAEYVVSATCATKLEEHTAKIQWLVLDWRQRQNSTVKMSVDTAVTAVELELLKARLREEARQAAKAAREAPPPLPPVPTRANSRLDAMLQGIDEVLDNEAAS